MTVDAADGTAIEEYSIAVDGTWYDVPLGEAGAGWADDLVARLALQDPARRSLAVQLEGLRLRLSADFPAFARVLAWIPQPESGYVGATLVLLSWQVGADGLDGPDAFVASLSEPDTIGDRDTLLEKTLWTGDIPAGRYGAGHLVFSAPQRDDSGGVDEETVVEETVFAVFPTGSTEFLQFTFTAESVASFHDMPQQTLDVVSTLSVRLGTSA